MAAKDQPELLQGTLEVMVLRTLGRGANHGYGIARAIELASGKALTIEEGSLYPALYRLEKRGLVESEWGLSDNNRKARFYKLTRIGRAHLRSETEQFTRFAAAVFKALAIDPQAA